MKLIVPVICILFFSTLQSQTETKKTFEVENRTIEYTRIDYSKYGVAHFFISMVMDEPQNYFIEKNASACLKRIPRLYHTLYFFLKIPKEIESLETKQKIFSEFVKHLQFEEKNYRSSLYLNFDINYSTSFQLEKKDEESLKQIKRILTEVSANTICKGLGI